MLWWILLHHHHVPAPPAGVTTAVYAVASSQVPAHPIAFGEGRWGRHSGPGPGLCMLVGGREEVWWMFELTSTPGHYMCVVDSIMSPLLIVTGPRRVPSRKVLGEYRCGARRVRIDEFYVPPGPDESEGYGVALMGRVAVPCAGDQFPNPLPPFAFPA